MKSRILIRSGMLNSSHNGEFIELNSNKVPIPYKHSDEPHVWTVWEHKLHSQIYYGERMALLSIFCFVTIVAVLGNLLTLYVVATRYGKFCEFSPHENLFAEDSSVCSSKPASSHLLWVIWFMPFPVGLITSQNYFSTLPYGWEKSLLWKINS